ncbi:MAG: hypothetical protein JRJ29_14150 [Deltaproteobacteria bacterium]|nr:hypothetical protein [Deltaproteobacteria bacterium]
MQYARAAFLNLLCLLSLSLPAQGNSLPLYIGPLALVTTQSGMEARKEIERLHGKNLDFLEGYIGSYSDGNQKAKLWISEYSSNAEAGAATTQMAQKIRSSDQRVFWHFREIDLEGTMVYFVVGMGQAHYFFNKGAKSV